MSEPAVQAHARPPPQARPSDPPADSSAVALRTHGLYASAGGALVAPRWVLTTAHAASAALAVFGGRLDLAEARGQTRRVVGAFRHRGYSHRARLHDIALLELADPAPQTWVDLAPDSWRLEPEAPLRISGWRLGSGPPSLTVRTRETTALPTAECDLRLREAGSFPRACGLFGAGPVAWPGDSGCPVVAEIRGRPRLVGCVACSGHGVLPDLHLSVAFYLEWIRAVLAGDLSAVTRCVTSPL